VNIASRLEGLTKQFGVPIVVSEATFAAVRREFDGRVLGEVTVKGKEQSVKVYEIESARRVG
jgi:adenylate cyclase